MMPSLRRSSGSTALELIVALAVLTVLTGLAFPVLGRTAPRKAVVSARDSFASLHATARASAIQYGRTTRLRIQEPSRLWIEATNSGAAVDTLGTVLDLDRDFGGVRVESNRSALCYGPRGLPVKAPGCSGLGTTVVVFARADIADTVTISAAGRLRRGE